MSTLEIRDLHVNVVADDTPKQILRGVDLTVRRGELPRRVRPAEVVEDHALLVHVVGGQQHVPAVVLADPLDLLVAVLIAAVHAFEQGEPELVAVEVADATHRALDAAPEFEAAHATHSARRTPAIFE